MACAHRPPRRLCRLLPLLGVTASLATAACTPPAGTPRADAGATSTTVAGGSVLVIGDSIVIGASGALTERLPGLEIDALVGRQFAEGLAVAHARAASGRLDATRIVVHLGTNGTVSRTDCDALLDLLAPRRVVLVNNAVPRSWEVQNNSTLAACAHRHDAAYVDWKTATLAGGLLASDGLHLTASGRTTFADLVAGRA